MSNYKEYSLVWNEVLDYMYKEIGSTSFEIWFSRVKFSSFKNNSFCIIVPDSLSKEWIESRYMDIMQNKLRSLIDQSVTLSITSEIISGKKEPVSALNPKYTFDTFVVGNSNRFAHAACYAVGESPFKSYNPLFIYGGVGLGKTHLMQAIGHHILSRRSTYQVMYVSSEQFTNDLISSIKDDTTSSFRNKYRSIDVLLVDDIQFLAGKERTQEEFFHTFNTLHESNKQVVISSDRPPRNIPTLEDRLRSRFEWGLITDIQPPDLETRIAILRKKAQVENLNIPYSILDYIANYIDSNIRELEGALIRLVAFATINNKPLDMNTAAEALKDILPPPRPRKITIETIQKTVAAHYNLEINEIISKKRNKPLVYPRHIAMYLCRKLTDASFPQIGEQFGGRDHTTVMHANEKLTNELLSDRELAAEIEVLCKKIDPNHII
ncbi:MAG: chromosomal replication initiator protein DnaA [Syntrophomonas sp.]|uniref:chromosomal replication initiator protein DnaA n=1 Tax=Syntrophomonas sp. TaxID=2053627 RepID=UPI0026029F34|nr:chromosomal replication initiator protein DnaA [Syntrophomonas sp.]MDD2510007.1 chromosomal replication initiator protein DnaA [Syntrophomonas sp.]MDD3878969.1 chromosomal replication initiator protein DnaA [Syntrophomonas sp.]MDD4626116.1 chromosomal replication initiator protein DnaA [Syntrophomonas sp.]